MRRSAVGTFLFRKLPIDLVEDYKWPDVRFKKFHSFATNWVRQGERLIAARYRYTRGYEVQPGEH